MVDLGRLRPDVGSQPHGEAVGQVGHCAGSPDCFSLPVPFGPLAQFAEVCLACSLCPADPQLDMARQRLGFSKPQVLFLRDSLPQSF